MYIRRGQGATFWTTARIHRAGFFAMFAGLLYAVGVPAVPGLPLTESPLLAAAVEFLAVLSLLGALGAVHARYGRVYGNIGLAVWGFTLLAMLGMLVGAALSVLPHVGVPVPELSVARYYLRTVGPLLTAMSGTVYGVVLWRAGAARPGSGLLGINAFVGFGTAALLGGVVTTQLAVDIPFGLAWTLVGHSLWVDRAMPSRLRPKEPDVGW